MSIALLHTDEYLGKWFKNHRPEVAQYGSANQELLLADCIIIAAVYFIEGEAFQILDLWETYLRKRSNKKQKLVVLGWTPSSASNYIQIGAIPSLDEAWYEKIPDAKQKRENSPTYPDLVDQDILQLLGRVLHSHGNRALYKLMSDAQRAIQKVEGSIERGNKGEVDIYLEKTAVLMQKAEGVWQERLSFFKLMPQFSSLQTFEILKLKWLEYHKTPKPLTPKLSRQIIDFNKNVLRDITKLYGFEKES